MAPPRRNRPVQLDVTPGQAALWIDRLREWASASRATGYPSWELEFERQAASLRYLEVARSEPSGPLRTLR